MFRNEVSKILIAVIMTGYLSKVMPTLPMKIEILLNMPLVKMIFLGSLFYIESGDAKISVVGVLSLFAAIYLLKMLIGESFEDADMAEISNNEYYSELSNVSSASDSMKSLLSGIAEKASNVQNFYSKQCQCNQKNNAKMQ